MILGLSFYPALVLQGFLLKPNKHTTKQPTTHKPTEQELRRPDGPLGLGGLSLAQAATLLGEERLLSGNSPTTAAANDATLPRGSSEPPMGAASTMPARARPSLAGRRVPSFRSLLGRFGGSGISGTSDSGHGGGGSIAMVESPATEAQQQRQRERERQRDLEEEEGEEEGVFGLSKPGARGRKHGSHGSLTGLAENEEAAAIQRPSYGTIGRGGRRGPALAAAAALQLLPPQHGNAQTLPLPPHRRQPPPPLPTSWSQQQQARRRPQQQVVEGDGESHLLLLTGTVEPLPGPGPATAAPAAAMAAVSAPPPTIVPNLKGCWALTRGTVAFLLSDARCAALAQAAADAQAQAAAGAIGPGALPSLSTSGSWGRGPSSSLRHRRLSTSLSLGSGTALAAAVAAANNTMTGAVSASAASPSTVALMQEEDAGVDVEAGGPARGL